MFTVLCCPDIAAAVPAEQGVGRSTQTTPQPSSATPVINQDYVLGPGDSIKIEVLKAPQYGLDTQVLVDGTISLVQAGRVRVQGLTLEQASAEASRQYAKLLRYPVVTITLVKARPIRVAITGEVERRGTYDLSASSDLNNTAPVELPTVTRALKVAGGITQSADLRQVEVRRLRYGQPDEIVTLNLLEYVRGQRLREDITLRDGDVIVVPTAKTVSLEESYELANVSFSGDRGQPLNIAVIGEVYRPGTYTVESSVRVAQAGSPGSPRDTFSDGSGATRSYPTISRALQTAGGVRPTADIRKIQLTRLTQTGERQTIDIDLWALLQSGDQKQDIILQDRDTIEIPQATTLATQEAAKIAASSFSPDRIRVSVVGEVERPGFLELPPNTPLNQAILAAGGYNRRAKQGEIQMLRVNPNGTVDRRNIDVSLAQTANEETNPALRNEDVIVVSRSKYSRVVDEMGSFLNPFAAAAGLVRVFFGY
jgi:polysaccharide export outer membrane protein